MISKQSSIFVAISLAFHSILIFSIISEKKIRKNESLQNQSIFVDLTDIEEYNLTKNSEKPLKKNSPTPRFYAKKEEKTKPKKENKPRLLPEPEPLPQPEPLPEPELNIPAENIKQESDNISIPKKMKFDSDLNNKIKKIDNNLSFGEDKKTNVSISASYRNSNKKPIMPRMSRRMNEHGTVILRVLVKKDGTAGKIEIKDSSGFLRLDNAAKNAVRNWRFNPATINGNSIDEWYQVPISFKLK